MFRVILCVQFYRLTQLIFFLHHLRALSAKNANHLQTTDTLKRHQRYSIHYHCGWPSLWAWGSATHNGLPALPEPFLRACGLHRVCTRHKKTKQQSRSMMFRVIPCMSPLEKVPFATFYPRWKYLCGTYISKKTFSSGLMYSILSVDATSFFNIT